MKSPKIKIETIRPGGELVPTRGRVAIDGKEIPGVRRVTTVVSVDEPPLVRLDLCLGHEVTIEDGAIHVSDVVMSPSLERALWEHLRQKYGRKTDVATIGSNPN